MKSHISQTQSHSDPAATDLSATLADGWRLWRSGEWDKAASMCKTLLHRFPDHGELLHLSGMVCWKKGQLGRAQALMEQAAFQINLPVGNRDDVGRNVGGHIPGLRFDNGKSG